MCPNKLSLSRNIKKKGSYGVLYYKQHIGNDMISYISISNCGVSVTLGIPEQHVKELIQNCKEFYQYQELDCPVTNQWLITPEQLINITNPDVHQITQHYEHLDEPDRVFLVDEERKILQILQPTDEKWLAQMLIRLSRDALRNLARHKMHFLHGAFVVYKDKGICILGDKRGGKTTSVLNILSSDYTAFISNDDVSIQYEDGCWMAYGWPRSLSVRRDSLQALKRIGINFSQEIQLSHPYNQNNVSNEYITFYPKDFSIFTNSPIKKSHKLDIVLFTSFANENKFVELDSESGVDKFNEYIEQDINQYFGELGIFFSREIVNTPPFKETKIRYFDIKQDFSGLKSITQYLDNTNLFDLDKII